MIREFILLLGFTLSQSIENKEVYLYGKHKIILEYSPITNLSNQWYVKLCISDSLTIIQYPTNGLDIIDNFELINSLTDKFPTETDCAIQAMRRNNKINNILN